MKNNLSYFYIAVENDYTSAVVGKQQTILIGCNFNTMILAKIDADSESLDEEFEFTF
ncbi:phage tail tube protein [Pseudostreptobacillus hongkongensis]|uniref:phage tail tube protein n=1 Tax=Pseudostreptobacillus hongkongensis TaxID=1162717 RepID=UPI0009E7A870